MGDPGGSGATIEQHTTQDVQEDRGKTEDERGEALIDGPTPSATEQSDPEDTRSPNLKKLNSYQIRASLGGTESWSQAEKDEYQVLNTAQERGLLDVHSDYDLDKISHLEWIATPEGQKLVEMRIKAYDEGLDQDVHPKFEGLQAIEKYLKSKEDPRRRRS